jgi:hypothetical protein
MDQAHFESFMVVVLTRATERILLVLVGALAIYLGYSLFRQIPSTAKGLALGEGKTECAGEPGSSGTAAVSRRPVACGTAMAKNRRGPARQRLKVRMSASSFSGQVYPKAPPAGAMGAPPPLAVATAAVPEMIVRRWG